MALDQYGGFGMSTPVPRRIYALVRLNTGVPKYEGGVGSGGMIEGVGDGMKIESVTGVPYATVRTLSSTNVKMQLKRLLVCRQPHRHLPILVWRSLVEVQ
jgi:nuclear pore complex protein Nup133